jgi:hypothetical protein
MLIFDEFHEFYWIIILGTSDDEIMSSRVKSMNIIYKSNLTQLMGATTGGDVVGQARGLMGSKGMQAA